MKRPALLLWCRVKTDSMARPLVIPIPLYLVEDFLLAVFTVLRFAGRWLVWQQHLRQLQPVLRELPRLLRELRSSGAYTLVEISDPDQGTEVVVRLV